MKDLLRRREGHALRRNAPKNYSILMGPQRDFACVMVPCGANDTQNAVTLDSALRITHSALDIVPQFHFPLSTLDMVPH